MPANLQQENLYEKLLCDVRFVESMNACMNCGICTAICPAAEFFDYDPRGIVNTVQSGNNEQIAALIESDTIWYCGQCMSCKTRCPRSNSPGIIITVLRKISQENGAFTQSRLGRKQYQLKKSIGENILKYGYTLHPSIIFPDKHPELGPVWKWVFDNREKVYQKTGANLDGQGAGVLRKISNETLSELKLIFEETGGIELFNRIELFSREKAMELNIIDENFEPDMDQYLHFTENE
jgi:heterodisulfide reductase subunit C1